SIPWRPAVKAPLTAKANTPTRSIRWRYMRRQVSNGRNGPLSPRDRFLWRHGHDDSRVRAATNMPSTPVSSVGLMTGAKFGEWLVGMS
ncbi:MAG: hypothetical protein M3341_09530, partial [Actinomycetota bacterium]|nr:hypothetical protein [Actinomycetota bacterium]